MSWQNKNIEGKSRGISKIRKRGCSSSSSSSLVQKYRFKRAILVGKRGGSSTPVPTWKTSAKSPNLTLSTSEQPKCLTSQSRVKGKEVSFSARKLAATLWEINKIPSPQVKKDLDTTKEKKDLRSREKGLSLRGSQSAPLPPHLSDSSSSPISERMDRSRGNSRRRRTSVVSQKVRIRDYNLGAFYSVSNASLTEIEALSRAETRSGCIFGNKTHLKDVGSSLTASKELLKVLNHVWVQEEQHTSLISLISAIRAEIDQARILVDQLIKEQRSSHNEIEYLMKHFAEEKAAWKRKERQRIRYAIACIAEELEVEKKLRRQTEKLNKKLGKELAEIKATLSNAMKERESEKKAKEILEQVCDELARGIGEDRAEVEELKRESVKVREEVAKEREMLQLADVLREERVQMKLSEAKYHFEEKNAAVERLRNELEVYLKSKMGDKNSDVSPHFERIKELEAYLKKIQFGSSENGEAREGGEGELVNGEEHEGDDSGDSDLHSIELNMDHFNHSYKWSYAYGDADQDDLKRVSVNKGCKGRKSLEKIQWGSICFGRVSSIGRDRARELDVDKKRLTEILSQTETQDHGDEIKRYRSIMSLRDRILSGSQVASLLSFASPTREWGQSLPLQCHPESQG